MPKFEQEQIRLAPITTAADVVGVHSRTIRRRIADGTIHGYRVGPKLIRVDLNEVETKLARIIPSAGGAS